MDSPQEAKGASPKGMKRCAYCGAKNKDSFEYCVRCSESLDSAPALGLGGRTSPMSTFVVAAIAGILGLGVIALMAGRREPAEPVATNNTPVPSPVVPVKADPILEGVDSRDLVNQFDEGIRAFNQGDYDTAISILQEVMQDIPDNPKVHQYLGLSYYQKGDYRSAMKALDDARALRPGSYELLDHYVTACKKGGQLADAVRALDEYVNANPDEQDARLELARLARQTGNTELAMAQTEILVRDQDADPEFVYEYGVSLKESGDLAGAKEMLARSVELDPESAAAHHALGVTELLMGNASAAIGSLEEAVAIAPSNGDFQFSLAQAYEKSDRIGESLAAYEAYLENASPNDPRAAVVRKQLPIAKKAFKEQQGL